MKQDDYSRLEKSYDFKRNYINETKWWASPLFIAPALLLFVGLVGILYLFRSDMLVSLYIIPYLLIFMVGTIWLKAVKKHIQKTMIKKEGSFLICVAHPVSEKNGYLYSIFTTDRYRHNKHYLNNIVKSLSESNITDNEQAKNKAIVMHDEESDTDYYVKAFPIKDIKKRNKDWKSEDNFPVLFIDEKYVSIIKAKDFNFF